MANLAPFLKSPLGLILLALSGLPLLAGIFCARVVARRRREGEPLLLPALAVALLVVDLGV